MAQIIREIRVDVSQPCNLQAILAKQYDCNSRFLKITLTDCGTKIDVSKTSKVTINTNRPDGQSKSFVGIANGDGTVTVPLPQWSLSIAGTLICDVSVTDTSKNERLTTMDIFVEVKEAANDNTDVSENPDGEIIVITPTKKISENSTDNEYPSAKAVYDLDNITATASGSAITIESANAPLQQLKLYGSTEQNGTPTPDAPVPLVSVGDSGSFDAWLCGKNIFDGIFEQGHAQHNSVAPTRIRIKNLIPISKGKKYTITKYNDTNNIFVFCVLSNITPKSYPLGHQCGTVNEWCYNSSYSFVATNDGVLGFMVKRKEDTTNISPTDLQDVKFQVEIGEATEYEPCNKQTLTMPYTLRKFDSATDGVDFARGVLIQRCYLATDFERYMSKENVDVYKASKPYPLVYNIGICSHTGVYHTSDDDKTHFYIGGGAIWVYIPKDADVSNLQVLCKLETPIETPLTETELNAYRHLMTNKGTTTVLSECEDTEITYYVNKPNAQAIGSLHEQINKDYFKLQQAIITTGGSTL